MTKLLGYIYYIFNCIVISITVYICCLFDSDNTPIQLYIVAFIGVCWCGINVFLYDLKKRREEARKNAKIRKVYSSYM